MDCDAFIERIDDALEGTEHGRGEMAAHASSCPRCGRALDRARALRRLLESIERIEPPVGLDARVLTSVGARTARRPARFLRVAAAILVVVSGASLALMLSEHSTYRPLNLRVQEVRNGPGMNEEMALQEIYGPGSPLLTASGEDARASDHR